MYIVYFPQIMEAVTQFLRTSPMSLSLIMYTFTKYIYHKYFQLYSMHLLQEYKEVLIKLVDYVPHQGDTFYSKYAIQKSWM